MIGQRLSGHRQALTSQLGLRCSPPSGLLWLKRTPLSALDGLSRVCGSYKKFIHLLNPFLENNLFLVKRLVQRTDQRNPDPSARRYTSLAWAAVLGHEETFEFLLANGHDDYEYSRVCPQGSFISFKCSAWHTQDSDNNYILMLLADQKPSSTHSSSSSGDSMGAVLRMARLYYDRYPKTLDWQNVHGKTALHFAAQRGSEELVRVSPCRNITFQIPHSLLDALRPRCRL
jgi:hypothetical protein